MLFVALDVARTGRWRPRGITFSDDAEVYRLRNGILAALLPKKK